MTQTSVRASEIIKRRKSFTIAFRRAAILHYNETKSYRLSSKHFGVDRKGLREWVKSKDTIFDPIQRVTSRKILMQETRKKGLYHEESDTRS